jgi:ankyrin repeat protein
MQMDNLHSASQRGDLATVKRLVEKGKDINSKEGSYCTPLHHASGNGHLKIVKFLVEKGADKDPKTYFKLTPLHLAAEKGYFEIVKFLVESGADKDAMNIDLGVGLYQLGLLSILQQAIVT